MSKRTFLGVVIIAVVIILTILVVGFVRGDFTFIYSDGSEFYDSLIAAYEKSEDITLDDKPINTFEFDSIAVIIFVDDDVLNVVPVDINKNHQYHNSGYQYYYVASDVKSIAEHRYSYDNETLYFGVCNSKDIISKEYSYKKLDFDNDNFEDMYFVYRIEDGE